MTTTAPDHRTGGEVEATRLLVLVAWTLAAGALTVWACRGHEGRRFR
ncbi:MULTISPECIES: hypothetical protein [unclassified Aeromicrobium]|nr:MULTISPECIES: hypothetical protein [unclassified Aeromicrobium]MCO7240395.1 hypothetical protein [Aeromicrobium sp. CnD17-E]MDR6118110.1 hypothetical protein [Aeromicrobium sp. SORGH_AS_0981]